MNREMLKECIADAKTIRETAIASAKVALEEAFTPQLTAMFAERLNELEEEDEMKNESVDEMYGMEEEGLEEDFNLDEILAELEMTDEGVEMEEEGMKQEVDEDLMLEDMSDEEIETLVMQVIDDMIASGKLMPGEGEEEGEEEMEDMEDMDAEDIDEDINLEELLAEMDSEPAVNEDAMAVGDATTPEALVAMGLAGALVGGTAWSSLDKEQKQKLTANVKANFNAAGETVKAFFRNLSKGKISTKETEEPMEEATTTEMEETINELRKELNEVNLLNAKLLYTNKIFKAKNLTESEKIKVLNTFDKAETVKEVKLVFETLTESFRATTVKKNPIKESLGSASKTISTATPKQPIIESNEAFARMQRLAGLKK
jgi:hypothetical protein